ncbi:hypothetical protein EJB05_21640 [Eragrostis curvula]|uniref:Serine/threonine-protein kinase BSK1-like TPR repeats domain-containing protein n=1 Tax=Eragrostis curvula TaxID=38414 RepID=A0A5J9V3R7_9POAL|nr:hypothetical protein EJB05_21640 [Eragrostis curvula]
MASPLTGGSAAQQRRLLQAADDGNLPLFKRVARALDGGKGRIREAVEAVKDRGVGALHVAAGRGRMPVCAYLVEELQCNKEFFLFSTPLYTALEARSLNCVKLLIKAGVDVMKGNINPLLLAASKGLTDFYEVLLEAGADPDVRDVDDPTYKMELADLKVEGSKAFKRKDYSTAEKLYTIAIMKDASVGDATLFSNRSLCWIKMGEGDKALIDAEACRLMQPEWPKACYRQGAAHMFLKVNYEKACDAFLDGLKLEPTDVEIENALREALNSLKISHAAKKLPESSSAVKET